MEDKNTPKLSQEEFAKYNGDRCPVCGGRSVSHERLYDCKEDISIDYLNMSYCRKRCIDCDATWTNIYKTVGYKDVKTRH